MACCDRVCQLSRGCHPSAYSDILSHVGLYPHLKFLPPSRTIHHNLADSVIGAAVNLQKNARLSNFHVTFVGEKETFIAVVDVTFSALLRLGSFETLAFARRLICGPMFIFGANQLSHVNQLLQPTPFPFSSRMNQDIKCTLIKKNRQKKKRKLSRPKL